MQRGQGRLSVLNSIQAGIRTVFFRVEGLVDSACGREANPFYHLGALGWFFYWIVAATGFYLFIPFETSAVRAWESVQYITVYQWYWGGVMRSLHRYASDALVLVMFIHLLREFALDRYHGARWFAWFTGVPLIWMVYASGITGYWLVWDSVAQYLAVGSFEWLDWLGIFGQSVARNFLTRGSLTDRFFTLLIFIHIAVPLFLLFAMWIHILRVNRSDTNPPKVMAIGSMLMMIGLSLAYPATSHEPADLGRAADILNIDWFYIALYPIFDSYGPAITWAVAIGLSVFLCVIPWLRKPGRAKAATVSLDNCSGCGQCALDCPFGAVVMGPRTDGRSALQQAVVAPDLCTGCGICVGACSSSTPYRKVVDLIAGINVPDDPLTDLRRQVGAAAQRLAATEGRDRVLVFGCDHGLKARSIAGPGVEGISLPCTGMLPPSFIDYTLSQGVDGVVLTGCRPGECHHRLGPAWTEERIEGARKPHLRKRTPRERVCTIWAAPTQRPFFETALAGFRADLKALPVESAPAGSAQEEEAAE